MIQFYKAVRDNIESLRGQGFHKVFDEALDVVLTRIDRIMYDRVDEAAKHGLFLRDTEHIKVIWSKEVNDSLTATVRIPNGHTIGLITRFGPDRFQQANMEIELLEIMYTLMVSETPVTTSFVILSHEEYRDSNRCEICGGDGGGEVSYHIPGCPNL